jgi:diacylglycerol kinase family enzyme
VRVILVHNPGAGDEDHSPERIKEAIESAGHEVYRVMTHEEPLREELTGRVDLVVVAGGDGTVRRIFKQLAGRATPVTLIPVGSANNIARALGFGDEADTVRLVSGWERGEARRYDVGMSYFGAAEKPFFESIGAGVFAEVMLRANDREEPGGDEKIEFGLRLLKQVLADAPAQPVRVEVDGRDVSADVLAVEVTNVPETGPRVPLDPQADPGDGLFEAVLIDPGSRGALIAYIDARLAGRRPRAPRFETHRGSRIALGLPAGMPLHLDDEMVVEDTAQAGIRGVAVTPGAVVSVLVPAGA